METFLLVKIFLLPFAVVSPAFFAGSETVLVSLSSISLQNLKNKFARLKSFIEFWENSPDKVLTTIILGNTFATVLCGVLAASIGKDFAKLLGCSGRWLIPSMSLFVTLLTLIFGEILPKIIGRRYSESFVPFIIFPLVILTKSTTFLNQILIFIAGIFIKILGAEAQKEIPTLSASELKSMLESDAGPDSVSTASSPRRILKNILEFGQTRVKDIQKSREDVIAIDIRKNPKEVIRFVTNSSRSRIPVYQESLDNIVGIIYIRDLLTAWRNEGLILIPDLLRPAYFVSEEMLVSELLREFRKGHYHFAVVQDAQKKVTGIITIEDVLEEIVGEVYDEIKMEIAI